MKKLMLMPLMAGVVWVCSASPVSACEIATAELLSHSQIDESLLKAIFTEAVPLFKDQYGIATTVAELQIGYDGGTVTVTKVSGDATYLVTKDGNDLIVLLDDYF